MSRSERYLPRHVRGPRGPRGPHWLSGSRAPKHVSPLTGFRRWRNRHNRHNRPGGPGRRWRQAGLAGRLTSVAGWALLLAGSVLVLVLAWRFIGDTVSADSSSRAPNSVRSLAR